MPRKVILDMDPGIGEAIALGLALGDPRLEVIAVTATGGAVGPRQATRNVQALIERIDPARRPRIGAASENQTLRTDARHLYGEDGLGGAVLPVADLVHRHASIKVIGDEVRAAPGELTIITTGPLSNLASVLQAEPDLAPAIGHLIICGGAVAEPGDITAAAEFNVFCDPDSARAVLRSPVTKTLVPLDVTRKVRMGIDWLEQLRKQRSGAAQLLQELLPGAFRAHRQRLAMEDIFVHEAVAVTLALHPELFTLERLFGDVECSGDLTVGATVFDLRPRPESPPNLDVATDLDAAGVIDCLLRGVAAAA
ncbi:MAG: nucleoside hydrolase [Planctomycetota bacterium]